MFRARFVSFSLLRLGCLTVALLVCISATAVEKHAITTLKLNPDAPVVDAFEAMDAGTIGIRMVPQSAYEGKVFFTNKTDKPLTVAVPKSVAGIQVLPQIGNFGGANGLGTGFGQGNGLGMGNGMMGGNGMAQSIGGSLNPANGNSFPNMNQQNANGSNLQGMNFFSIPPEKTVQLELRTVCLNYGRPDPTSTMTYKMVKVESATSNPVLQQLIEDYSPRTNRDVQQAAAWNVANGLTWQQIANLTTEPLPGIPTPLFDPANVGAAQKLVEQTQKKAEARPKKPEKPIATAVRK